MPSIPICALSSKGENLSTLGSTFTYRFKTSLQVPSDVECTLSLYQSSLWHVQKNIGIALGNNTMQFSFANLDGNGFDDDYTQDDSDDGSANDDPYSQAAASENNTMNNTENNTETNTENNTDNNTDNNVFTYVFEDGLYSLKALQTALKRKLVALYSDLTGDEITLSPDNAQ